MDHFLFNTPRLLVGTKSDLRDNTKRISELNTNGQQLITIEQVLKVLKIIIYIVIVILFISFKRLKI
jgi:GTPase SAR1 family protein